MDGDHNLRIPIRGLALELDFELAEETFLEPEPPTGYLATLFVVPDPRTKSDLRIEWFLGDERMDLLGETEREDGAW